MKPRNLCETGLVPQVHPAERHAYGIVGATLAVARIRDAAALDTTASAGRDKPVPYDRHPCDVVGATLAVARIRDAAVPDATATEGRGKPVPTTSASVRQPEHPLGDDVELHLVAAAGDRTRLARKPCPGHAEFAAAEAFARPADAAGSHHRNL